MYEYSIKWRGITATEPFDIISFANRDGLYVEAVLFNDTISQILNIPIKDLLYENETPSYKEGYQLGKAFAYEVFATIFLTPSNISIEKIKEKLQDCLPNSSKYDYSKSIEYLLEVRKILLKNQTLDENDKKRIDECISLSLNSILPMSPDEQPPNHPDK